MLNRSARREARQARMRLRARFFGSVGVLLLSLLILFIVVGYRHDWSARNIVSRMQWATQSATGVSAASQAASAAVLEDSPAKVYNHTVPVQLWHLQAACPQALGTQLEEERRAHGYTLPNHGYVIKSGSWHERLNPILLRVKTDSQGIVRVPVEWLTSAQTATISKHLPTAITELDGALPAGRASDVYCIVDLVQQQRERDELESHMAAVAESGGAVSIDAPCMNERWRRCSHVLHLEKPGMQPRVDMRLSYDAWQERIAAMAPLIALGQGVPIKLDGASSAGSSVAPLEQVELSTELHFCQLCPECGLTCGEEPSFVEAEVEEEPDPEPERAFVFRASQGKWG